MGEAQKMKLTEKNINESALKFAIVSHQGIN